MLKQSQFRSTVIFACLSLVAAASTANAIAVYVDDDASPGGDGLSWSSPFQFLQDALDYAADPGNGVSEIHVAGGTHWPDQDTANPAGTGSRNATFSLLSGVSLEGGYLGLDADVSEDPDSRDIVLYETVLSGDLAQNDNPNQPANYGENSFHVLTGHGVNTSAILDGLTIAAGYANGGGATLDKKKGGGLYCLNGSPSLRDCFFTANFAEWSGAAINCEHGNITLTACIFDSNLANDHNDEAVRLSDSDAAVTDCEFTANQAAGLSQSLGSPVITNCVFSENEGRALSLSGTSAVVTDCAFIDNTAGAAYSEGYLFGADNQFINCSFIGNSAVEGGAMITDGRTQAIDCLFDSNSAGSSPGNVGGGGAINSTGVNVTNCTFLNNSTTSVGGAIRGYAEVVDCTFTGNAALSGPPFPGGAGRGGAVDSDGLYDNCLFEDNTATAGGAVYTSNGEFTNCTFVDNSAATGGAMYTHETGEPRIVNCWFESNSASSRGGALYTSGFTGDIDNPPAPGHPSFFNCVFFANASPKGGAFYAARSEVKVVNCTLVRNEAGLGGGILTSATSAVFVRNSIIKSNTGGSFSGAGVRKVRYSNIGGGHAGVGNINANPLFIDTNDADLRLLAGSPCIDAGRNSYLPGSITTDIDGNPRFADDPATPDSGSGTPPIVDMGAYEFQD